LLHGNIYVIVILYTCTYFVVSSCDGAASEKQIRLSRNRRLCILSALRLSTGGEYK